MKEYMDWDKFEQGCKEIAKQIKKSKFKPEVIFTIPRGGFPVATRLSHLLKIKAIITDKQEAERNFVSLLIVDDVSDTGNTLLREFPNVCIGKIATLYYKPQSKVKPDYYAFETDKWIVFPWENI